MPEDEEPYLEGKALREQVGDIELTPWPPPPRLTLGFAATYPFQVFGVGVGAEGYLGSIVRLSGFVSGGFTFGGTPQTIDAVPSFFAEATVGVRVLAFDGRIAAHVDASDLKTPGGNTAKPKPLFHAWLPATHAFLLEGGMLTGTLPLGQCTADCANDDITLRSYRSLTPVLFYPEAGRRYVFFSQASSLREPAADRRWQIELFVHAVFRALNDPSEATADINWEHVKRSPLGGRGGFTVPICGRRCLHVSLMGGYLPSPDTVTFSAGVGY